MFHPGKDVRNGMAGEFRITMNQYPTKLCKALLMNSKLLHVSCMMYFVIITMSGMMCCNILKYDQILYIVWNKVGPY